MYALGRLGLVEASPRIREELKHPSADVRLAAIWALGRLGDDGAGEALAGMLRSLPMGYPGAAEGPPLAETEEGPALLSDADARQFDALVQALGRLVGSNSDPLVLRALIDARARVREEEWERPARLPRPSSRGAARSPRCGCCSRPRCPVLAEEEGEI